jgi:uncharacterized protein YuzE
MEMTYDKTADAAYIYLNHHTKRREVKKTIPASPNIILDYDAKNKLIGIEILSASKVVDRKAIHEMASSRS